MVVALSVEEQNHMGRLIASFERYQLEGTIPEEFDPQDLFNGRGQTFFRIQGLANFWRPTTSSAPPMQASANFGQYMADMVIAAHNQHLSDLMLVLLGLPGETAFYISLGTEESTRTLLEGIFPGIVLDPISVAEIKAQLCPHFVVKGVITGIPSNKTFGAGADISGQLNPQGGASVMPMNQDATQLERVVRGMYGATWAYIVQAHPRPRPRVVEERMKIIDLLTQVNNRMRVQWSSSHQDNEQETTSMSGGSSHSYSGDVISYRAQYLIRLLERDLERHDLAMASGQWTVRTYFGAGTVDEAQRLSSLLLGVLAGADSRPQPLRAIHCQRGGISLENFYTYLNSHEVGMLVRLLREEVPGFAIHDHVRFDVDFRPEKDLLLPLGRIQQNGRDTSRTYDISLDALAKHAVVIGVTGSGKTTTVMNLLDTMVEAKRPFLIIEPAKTEYRALRSAFATRTDLRIYTLGNETIAPFRMNPFEFETDDEPGSVSLLSHIDFLKAVFNAAFPLYAPMPQVLEAALHEIYEDKGWDLTNGINYRLENWADRHIFPIFPTLTDLYYKVEDVTNRLGYHHEIESNVKAALKSRIGSLRIGSKGLMLDTSRGVSMRTLLSIPTILELESIGNDDEKTFLMGLFLAKLYEYRRLQAATGTLPKGLQHVIVFEEAHRLLKNVSNTQVSDEGSNPRAQAIEVFTNMLSEVRAYGQGVLVAEQIPSKLAPDVLKNTNLKIVHRLIAKDDRQSIGETMNMNEDQQTHLGVLTPGMAAVYAEGADHAYLVRLDNYKRKLSPLIDRALKVISVQYASVKDFQSILDLDKYGVSLTRTDGPDPMTYQAAGKLLEGTKSRWLWANILLRLITTPTNMFDILLRFSEHIEAEMAFLPANQYENLLRMVLVRGCFELMQQRGAQFGWTYEQVEELRFLFTLGLSNFSGAYYDARRATADQMEPEELEKQFLTAMEEAGKFLEQFVNRYKILMQRQQGPFGGCTHCPSKCHYRSEVKILLSTKNREWISEELSNDAYNSEAERYRNVAHAAKRIAQNWLGEEKAAEPGVMEAEVGYCAVLHTIASPDYTEYEQVLIGNGLQAHFF